jgi:hypothetical protein
MQLLIIKNFSFCTFYSPLFGGYPHTSFLIITTGRKQITKKQLQRLLNIGTVVEIFLLCEKL